MAPDRRVGARGLSDASIAGGAHIGQFCARPGGRVGGHLGRPGRRAGKTGCGGRRAGQVGRGGDLPPDGWSGCPSDLADVVTGAKGAGRAGYLVAVVRPAMRLVIGSGGMTMAPSLSAAIFGPSGFGDAGADHPFPAASDRSCRYAGLSRGECGAAVRQERELAVRTAASPAVAHQLAAR